MTLLDDGNYLEKIAKRLSDLFVNHRDKYLLLDREGKYYTMQHPQTNPVSKYKSRPLLDFHLKYHLENRYTIGVFAHPYSAKFICFDVDYVDIEKANQVVTKLIAILNSLGINNDFINVSWSGNKGYHVEIFFVKPIRNSVIQNFYKAVLYRASLSNGDGGKVEFRPTYQLGVKLPLGVNYKNKNILTNKCWFVDFQNSFKMIRKFDHVFQIQQIEPSVIYDIVYRSYREIQHYDLLNSSKQLQNSMPWTNNSTNNSLSTTNYMTANSIDLIKLEKDGLKEPRTRNNALVGLCILFKCHYRMNKDECTARLIEWMRKQDPNFYKTPLVKCYEEIRSIANCAYQNNYQLSGSKYAVELSEKEIEAITTVKEKNGKLLLFSISLHSKKYADKDGIFYMSFRQMVKITGLSDKTCQSHLNKLVNSCYILAVSRKKPTSDGKLMETNQYKVLISPGGGVKKINVNSIDPRMIRSAFHESLSLLDDKILRNNLNNKEFYSHKRWVLHKKILNLLSSMMEVEINKGL